jgi:toxin ParE1/3/4
MNSEFLPDAENEFREATRYYETEAPGVGVAFVTEVRRAIRWIIENPYAAVAFGSGIRSKMLNHFPYNILYAVERDLILIVAVAHRKRRPKYWRARIKQIKERRGTEGRP